MSKCPDCNSVKINAFDDEGDGKCDECRGTGLGQALDQFVGNLVHEPSRCLKCSGTGQCQTCGGTGTVTEKRFTQVTRDFSSSSDSGSESGEGSPPEFVNVPDAVGGSLLAILGLGGAVWGWFAFPGWMSSHGFPDHEYQWMLAVVGAIGAGFAGAMIWYILLMPFLEMYFSGMGLLALLLLGALAVAGALVIGDAKSHSKAGTPSGFGGPIIGSFDRLPDAFAAGAGCSYSSVAGGNAIFVSDVMGNAVMLLNNTWVKLTWMERKTTTYVSDLFEVKIETKTTSTGHESVQEEGFLTVSLEGGGSTRVSVLGDCGA